MEPQLNSGDTAWLLTATALVLLMTIPGLALFYAGLVRKKNVLSTMMQSFAACCLLSIIWVIAGYSLVFADGGAMQPTLGGLSKFALSGITPQSISNTVPEFAFMTYQMAFAIITPAVICGAFADRMKFSSLLVFLAGWLLLVYVPVAHWVWGGGFLGKLGLLDFAGGTVVEINSGVAGLVCAYVLGKRTGYPTEPMQPHNMVLTVIGGSLLWIGWLGFNGGSGLAANGTAALAFANTQIAGATAGLAWMAAEWRAHGKPSVLGIVSGAVAGLVGITPACAYISPMGAIVVGAAAGLVCFWAATSLKRRLGYDDSLDVFAVHGMGGLVGTLLTGVLASAAMGGTAGLLEGNLRQFMVQLLGCAVTAAWCAIASYVILQTINAFMGLRVSREVEIEGLDLNLHGESVP